MQELIFETFQSSQTRNENIKTHLPLFDFRKKNEYFIT